MCLSVVLQVVVGNVECEVGQLQYQVTADDVGGGGGGGGGGGVEADYWLAGSAVGGGTMLSVIVVIVAVYKRKSSRAQRQFQRLQLQLDSLETNIRNECKQGKRPSTLSTAIQSLSGYHSCASLQ